RLGVDLAAVGDVETIGARRDRLGSGKADLLGGGIERRGQDDGGAASTGRREPRRSARQLVGVERQRLARLENAQGNALGAGEGQLLRVGAHVDVIVK